MIIRKDDKTMSQGQAVFFGFIFVLALVGFFWLVLGVNAQTIVQLSKDETLNAVNLTKSIQTPTTTIQIDLTFDEKMQVIESNPKAVDSVLLTDIFLTLYDRNKELEMLVSKYAKLYDTCK